MTQNEIVIINAINREGLDNSMWGITSEERDTAHYFGTLERKIIPPSIYVYREPDGEPLNCGITPNHTCTDSEGSTIDIYYLHDEAAPTFVYGTFMKDTTLNCSMVKEAHWRLLNLYDNEAQASENAHDLLGNEIVVRRIEVKYKRR